MISHQEVMSFSPILPTSKALIPCYPQYLVCSAECFVDELWLVPSTTMKAEGAMLCPSARSGGSTSQMLEILKLEVEGHRVIFWLRSLGGSIFQGVGPDSIM